MKRILRLRHKKYFDNKEDWNLDKQGNIFVISDCPSNYPRHNEHTLTPIGAMQQFILMTSPEEGWEVTMSVGWHDWVEGL